MRNWNSQDLTIGDVWKLTRFYRTYEELKRTVPAWDKGSFIGFYRTYEELKLILGIVFNLTLHTCFYRTYEELKLINR